MENWRRHIAREGGTETATETENRPVYRSDLKVVVRTVEPLSPDIIRAIADKVRRAYQRDVLIEVEIDHSLLGGMMVLIGHRVIDMSLATHLRRMSSRIAERLEEVVKELDQTWERQLTAHMEGFLADLRQKAALPLESEGAEAARAAAEVVAEGGAGPALEPGEALAAAPAGQA